MRTGTLNRRACANHTPATFNEIPLFIRRRRICYRCARLAGEDAQYQFVWRRGHRYARRATVAVIPDEGA
ncbi:MAG: hypothetical protein E3J37_03030 [Anaerolineales bacterium]|nr:MAG: hypothetical protein E3J37_03030 [Anaerolineales bacterium]